MQEEEGGGVKEWQRDRRMGEGRRQADRLAGRRGEAEERGGWEEGRQGGEKRLGRER